ncbi:MAG: type II secretion system protein [Planctomycetota bacterium]|nr:type II secretion system protein [Planctomycetota bacterium]
MKNRTDKNMKKLYSRRGLTLVEMMMVMLIMVGLAAVLIPLFGNVVGLTHGSSSAANCESIARSFEQHKAMYAGYPNQLDLLLTDNTDATTLAPFGGTVDAAELTTTALSERIADALLDAGIVEVVENPAEAALLDEEDQTNFGLGDTDGGTERLIAVDEDTPSPGNVVILGATAISRLGLAPADLTGATEGAPLAYVVLGVGNNNDGIGKSMLDAPVHFLANGGSNEEIYSRFLVVLRIPAEEGGAILSSVVGVDVHHGEGEVVGLNRHVREFHHSREQ